MSTTILSPVGELQPGMVLAEPVYHPSSFQQLLGPGTVLDPTNIYMLVRCGVSSVPVFTFQTAETPIVQPETEPEPQPAPRRAMTGPLGNPFKPAGEPPVAMPPRPRLPSVGTGGLGRALGIPQRSAGPAKPSPNAGRFAETKLEKLAKDVTTQNLSSIRSIQQKYKESAAIDFQAADDCVQSTITQIVNNKELLNSLCDLRVYDEYTYAHSANVMSLSLLMGVTLGYTPAQLRMLGIGALLHDIGKNQIPDFILNKPAKLTEAEFNVMKSHPEKGLRLIENYRWATPEIKGIIMHHHEKWAGGGYPYNLKGTNIPEMARVVAVCDVWDALISNRVYKKGMPPERAYKIILEGMDTHFERRMVWAFQHFIVPYPKNALVVLNSGEVAKVVKVNREACQLPVVELEGQLIDLAKHGRLQVSDLYREDH
ncbi:Cyclic di-GMP phosphodiesterase response regulator RpfG [compost metagenome]